MRLLLLATFFRLKSKCTNDQARQPKASSIISICSTVARWPTCISRPSVRWAPQMPEKNCTTASASASSGVMITSGRADTSHTASSLPATSAVGESMPSERVVWLWRSMLR